MLQLQVTDVKKELVTFKVTITLCKQSFAVKKNSNLMLILPDSIHSKKC